MASRKYAKSLDYEIESITIGSLRKDDIRDSVIIHGPDFSRWFAISIYEDLFRNFMTCEIVLYDQDGFFLNRFRTDEVIVIKFVTPDLEGFDFKPRFHYFYLYKIDSIAINQSPHGALYTLKGVSFEHFYNTLRTFSKAYKGKTHEIATDIYKEFLLAKTEKTVKKTFTCGRPTKHDMKFSFPYVNPVDAINHLASVSVDSINPDICNYVFFENKEGFNFISISELIEKPRRIHKYKTQKPMNGESFFTFSEHFDKTIEVAPIKTGDKIIDTLDGVYGEYFAEYDLLYRTYTPFLTKTQGTGLVEGKRYLDYFPKTKHLNKQPLLAKENILFENPLGRNRVCFTNHALYSEEQKLSGTTQSQWKLYETHEEKYSFQRRSMMQQMNSFTVQMTVPGNSEITVGDIVDLDTVIYRSSDPDKYLSGRYLVTAVNHLITLPNYVTIVTMSRDSVLSNDFDDQMEAGE